ncbi:MAG: glycosyltransferase family 39 protein [bacterium]|nr:glycosyltransferase family 39 protein [bacterium]
MAKPFTQSNESSRGGEGAGVFSPSLIRWLLILTVAFFVGYHLIHITEPPNGYHEWREALTASISLSYYQESMSFFEPRVHYRGATPGINGMEFPIVNYAIAILYSLFGPHHWLARVVMLLCTGGALLLLFRLVRRWFGFDIAVCTTFALVMSPLSLFYASKILPDSYVVLPLMLSVWAYWRWHTERSWGHWVVAALFLAIAGAIKPTCLTLYLPFLYLTLTGPGKKWREVGIFTLFILISFLPVVIWVEYARSLAMKYQTNAFYLGQTFAQVWAAIQSGWFIKMNLLQRPWELWVGWTLAIPFVLGLYRAGKSNPGRFLLFWTLGNFIGLLMIAHHSAMHDYDGTLIVLPIAGITGLGLYHLLSLRSNWRWVAVALMLAAPINAVTRLDHRYDDPPFEQIRAEADATISFDELVIAEDWSPIIRLYQLNRFGWAMRPGVTEDWVRQAVEDGADWFVLEKPLSQQRFDLLPYLVDTTPTHIGPLLAFRIKQPN